MVCGIVGLRVWGLLENVEQLKNRRRNLCQNTQTFIDKSFKITTNPSKIGQNASKIDKNRFLDCFGAFSAPCRTQVGFREARPGKTTTPLEPFSLKMVLQGSILGSPGTPKWLQNRTFEHRSALGPSKNCLREGFRKKHEKLMKNGSNNHWFWGARNVLNHVSAVAG